MESEFLVLHAVRDPMVGIANPGPHQTYRDPCVSVETREIGDLLPDNIRVEMIYAGLCGTDIHLVDTNPETGYIRTSAPAEIPDEGRIIGHEGVGKVIDIGTNVRHIKRGAYVTFESIIVCHYCEECRKGQFNQCRNAKLVGLERNGLFGTVVDIPSMLAHDVSGLIKGDKELRAAACVEPAGVAYVACQNSRIAGGDVVVVFGAGPIGLFTSALAKTVFGCSEVHIVEPIEFRREFAKKWNGSYVYNVDEFFDNCPKEVDVVIEASGDLNNITRIFRQVNANGRIVLLARSGAPLTLNALDHMITNEISLVGSRGHLCGAFSDILRLYNKRWIPLDNIVTEVVDGLEGLCGYLKSPEIISNNCKVLVRINRNGRGI